MSEPTTTTAPASVLDRARSALRARMAKDDLRLVLENVIAHAERLERKVAGLTAEQERDDAEYAEAIRDRDRYQLAWKSARERAQAYGEGILRAVADRESYQLWLREAEAKLLKLQYGCETPESHNYGCPCESEAVAR